MSEIGSYTARITVKSIGPVSSEWGAIRRGGGVATHIQSLLTHLPGYGIDPRLLADNTDDRNPLPDTISQNVTITQFIRPTGKNLFSGVRKLGVASLFKISYRLFAQDQVPNIPFQHKNKFIIQAANFKRFLEHGDYDLLHIHHAEFRQYLCQNILQVNKPLVITAHSATTILDQSRPWIRQIIKLNYSKAKWIIAVSSFVREMITKYYPSEAIIQIIPNGVDTRFYFPIDKNLAKTYVNIDPNYVYLLFSGKLSRHKGVDVLLQAFARVHENLPKLRCLIAGAGDELNILERLAGELGIRSKIEFLGFISLSEMAKWYQAADIHVLPSFSEGLSISVLEALASGLPVITTQPSIGDHDAVIPGGTGLLTPYADVDALAHAIEKLMLSPETRYRMGMNARKAAEDKFDISKVAQQTAQFYRRVLSEAR